MPIILLKHFKDSNLNLTDLILSLLEKNTPDAQNLFQNLEAFLGSASFRNQKAEAERRINVKNATVKNYRNGYNTVQPSTDKSGRKTTARDDFVAVISP